MRKLIILLPATILVLILVAMYGPSPASAPVRTVPASPCDLAPEASDYVNDCLSLLSRQDGADKVAECLDLDAQGQASYAFQQKLNAEGWTLGECFKAMPPTAPVAHAQMVYMQRMVNCEDYDIQPCYTKDEGAYRMVLSYAPYKAVKLVTCTKEDASSAKQHFPCIWKHNNRVAKGQPATKNVFFTN